ncbi:DUF4435 domain-containing protein [Myroides marinus]|uniref:DUF4435 domain-containing protein n=1 Tax=Myroides marinus TaxID=703342 RepID=UPI00257503ED|nr:DUF4435 domain-containing protein [Myroides marinus]MDM1404513.1 hypothetical protein [Myroides marinus]MDM1534242.1 hypothetical protein [Myroides marinus]MDM1541206.1 hypothetical protein [Myroides marinus]
MLTRNIASNSARSVLLEDFNDIDIYVEDTSGESKKFYAYLLKKATNEEIKISSVLPLGGSKETIQEWIKHRKNNDGRRKLFIIDGDFYLINNNQ